jgi:hypothetical protein
VAGDQVGLGRVRVENLHIRLKTPRSWTPGSGCTIRSKLSHSLTAGPCQAWPRVKRMSNERRRTGRFRPITDGPPNAQSPCIHGHFATSARTTRTAQSGLITRRSRVRIRYRPHMQASSLGLRGRDKPRPGIPLASDAVYRGSEQVVPANRAPGTPRLSGSDERFELGGDLHKVPLQPARETGTLVQELVAAVVEDPESSTCSSRNATGSLSIPSQRGASDRRRVDRVGVPGSRKARLEVSVSPAAARITRSPLASSPRSRRPEKRRHCSTAHARPVSS